jgi:hypothetical protein
MPQIPSARNDRMVLLIIPLPSSCFAFWQTLPCGQSSGGGSSPPVDALCGNTLFIVSSQNALHPFWGTHAHEAESFC